MLKFKIYINSIVTLIGAALIMTSMVAILDHEATIYKYIHPMIFWFVGTLIAGVGIYNIQTTVTPEWRGIGFLQACLLVLPYIVFAHASICSLTAALSGISYGGTAMGWFILALIILFPLSFILGYTSEAIEQERETE